ncbi:tetratricopeptide repeat protein [Streptomyces gibsoniae]|uniref:Tetratricopeptide repeat protein n=1 Tax=Streptomyces gibsoniae TaxID=3075529 RepID=A0ABU2U1K0_9ACTN|nr:tetratricopeptide repeat protein [Streptomyces sp. DSM 41699]MDT0467049.1 tetratricopeptide repeat protein [Streptomyces sp. DSM 41699]
MRPNEDPDVLLQTALVEIQQFHDSQGAARTYRHILKLDPHNKVAWYNLGVIAQQDDRKSDAREAYEKALKIDPQYESALFNEAILLRPSEPDRAMGLLKRVIAVDPKAGTAHLNLGHILADKHQVDGAKNEFRRAVEIDPSLRSSVPERFQGSISPSSTSNQAGSTR